jgi:hypothetical protein
MMKRNPVIRKNTIGRMRVEGVVINHHIYASGTQLAHHRIKFSKGFFLCNIVGQRLGFYILKSITFGSLLIKSKIHWPNHEYVGSGLCLHKINFE